jgi:3-oxoadipate enol-lactonase
MRTADWWVMEARQNLDPEAWARVAESLVYSPEWVEANREVVARALVATKDTPAEMRHLHNQISLGHDAWEFLPRISAPTLVIHGSDDGIVPIGNAYLLAEHIRNAELHIVQGGRHGYLVEYQNQASRVVLDFLARHPLGF